MEMVLLTALGVGSATVIGSVIGFLFKKISHQDAIDTVEAVKKYIKKTDEGLEHLLNTFRHPNP